MSFSFYIRDLPYVLKLFDILHHKLEADENLFRPVLENVIKACAKVRFHDSLAALSYRLVFIAFIRIQSK